MEFLLNFAWVMLSALLLGRELLRRSTPRETGRWQVLIALGVLLLLLLPVISMTDDLQAQLGSGDVEQMFRKPLEPVHPAAPAALAGLIVTAALLLERFRYRQVIAVVSRFESGLMRLLEGLLRAVWMRPPPSLLAAQ